MASTERVSGLRLLVTVTAVATLAAVGCGGGANRPHPVRGTVFLDGQPATELAGGTVTFTSPQLHKSASGAIQADGTYRLGTFTEDDGAIPGRYQVSVSPPERASPSERGNQPHAPSGSFEVPKNLEVTVEPKSNDIPIELHSITAPRR